MAKIKIPYKPRAIWASEIHPALDKHRFAVMVCHRRFGKSVGTINHLLKKAVSNNLPAPQFAYIAPYRYQAKQIAWGYLKYYAAVVPELKINESELYIELPSKHKNRAGAKIYIIGADHPDGLRGTYWDGVVLDEYAQIKPELWGEVIRPALSDRQGFAWFIGTPKGQNQFYEIFNYAQRNKDWFTCLHRADETGIIPTTELQDMEEAMTPIEVRQELLCDFTASASDVLITVDVVSAASSRNITADEVKGLPLIFGVDVARYGDDRSVIAIRQGQYLHDLLEFNKLNNMELASRIAYEIDSQKPDAVFIDAGQGGGVIDRLRQLGYTNIIEVPFGSTPDDRERYCMKAAEMWYRMKEWLEQGGSLPNNSNLKTELTSREYCFDAVGKIRLQKKEEIKKLVGRSPDLADAVALTFAHTVIPAARNHNANKKLFCNTDYNPFSF